MILLAQWEAVEITEPTEPGMPDADEGACIICGRKPTVCALISLCWICLLIILLILIGILLLILLWKHRYIKYSLQNGDIQMNYKNGKHKVLVEVVLINENRKHSLNQSDVVTPKTHLRFIKNLDRPIIQVKPGKYQGQLIIIRGRVAEVRKCRIMAVDKELNEK